VLYQTLSIPTFLSVKVWPLPQFHDQETGFPPVVVSVSATEREYFPEVRLTVKLACPDVVVG